VSIAPADVDWIEADSYYAKLHVGRAEHLLRESLTSLEARLDPARFVRVHRSAIVNVERVRAVDRDEALLAGGARGPVARDRCRALLGDLERGRGGRRGSTTAPCSPGRWRRAWRTPSGCWESRSGRAASIRRWGRTTGC